MFETKDSGKRAEYESGMVRDTEDGKARFDLLFPIGVPFSEQMLTRFAQLMERGAVKYSERNWEKARGEVEMARYRSSALRHMIQWMTGETDEDHAAAVMFNLLAHETTKFRQQQPDYLCWTLEDGTCASEVCDLHHPSLGRPYTDAEFRATAAIPGSILPKLGELITRPLPLNDVPIMHMPSEDMWWCLTHAAFEDPTTYREDHDGLYAKPQDDDREMC